MNPVSRLTTTLAAAFLAAATAACDSKTTPTETSLPDGSHAGIVAGTLEATANKSTLTLRNTTDQIVGYMVVEKDMAVVALFPPCGPTCPKLVQGTQVTLPYADIPGYSSRATEVRVMWWTYIRTADGSLQATGAVQSKTVKL